MRMPLGQQGSGSLLACHNFGPSCRVSALCVVESLPLFSQPRQTHVARENMRGKCFGAEFRRCNETTRESKLVQVNAGVNSQLRPGDIYMNVYADILWSSAVSLSGPQLC